MPQLDLTHRLYCDEAGNTGANYLDQQQPVMVFASWMVPTTAESDFLAAFSRLAPGSQSPEVHAHRLLSRPGGWSRAADFITAAMEGGSVPFFYVVEKRYQLAERIVHALLDSETNPRAAGAPTAGSPDYALLVEYLHRLPEPALSPFAAAVARPSEASVRAGIEAVVGALSPLNARLARDISGCLENLSEVIDCDFSDRNGFRHAQLTSPHLPGVMRMLEVADAYAETQRFGAVEVFHDETAQYAEVLCRYVDVMVAMGEHGKVPHVKPNLPRIGFAHLRELRTLRSHEHGGIQAADVLAASIYQIVRRSASGCSWRDHQPRVAKLLFTQLLDDDLTHGGVSASSPFVAGLRARLLSNAPH